MVFGATGARHAAAVAIVATGAPEATSTRSWSARRWCPTRPASSRSTPSRRRSASLAAIPITIGAPNKAGTRATINLETPAANSFVYEGETCSIWAHERISGRSRPGRTPDGS